MKFLAFLPILASAKERKKFDDRITYSYENLCVDQVPDRTNDGTISGYSAQQIEDWGYDTPVPSFETVTDTDSGRLWGTVTLDNYSDNLNCHYVVNAEPDCKEIKITLRDVAVETASGPGDHFRFSWEDSDGYHITPHRFGCYGDGCSESLRGWST